MLPLRARYRKIAAPLDGVVGALVQHYRVEKSKRATIEKVLMNIWEVKTDDGGIHDKDNRYRWGGAGADTYGTEFYNDWDVLLDGSNNEQLCGYNDWHVPDFVSLQSIVNFNRFGPAIDTAYFPNTVSNRYWSTSASTESSSHARHVSFYSGRIALPYYRSDDWWVRLMRGGH